MSRIQVLLLLAYFSSCYNTKFAHQQHNSDSTKPNTIWYWNVAVCWWQIRFIPHTYLTYLILLNVRSRNSLSNIEICKFKHRNPVVFSSRRQPVICAIFTKDWRYLKKSGLFIERALNAVKPQGIMFSIKFTVNLEILESVPYMKNFFIGN